MLHIYIASPYTHGDREANVRASIAVADEVIRQGAMPYVPLLSHYWHSVSPKPYEEWMRIDLAWLAKCDALIRVPGYSPGADREVEFARANGIRVFTLEQWRDGR